MKMLEDPEYVLCEIHEFGERRLGTEEKPLLGRTRLVVDRDKPVIRIRNYGVGMTWL